MAIKKFSVMLLPSIIKTGNRRILSRSENFSAINPIILHIQSRQYGYDFYESVGFLFFFASNKNITVLESLIVKKNVIHFVLANHYTSILFFRLFNVDLVIYSSYITAWCDNIAYQNNRRLFWMTTLVITLSELHVFPIVVCQGISLVISWVLIS